MNKTIKIKINPGKLISIGLFILYLWIMLIFSGFSFEKFLGNIAGATLGLTTLYVLEKLVFKGK